MPASVLDVYITSVSDALCCNIDSLHTTEQWQELLRPEHMGCLLTFMVMTACCVASGLFWGMHFLDVMM